VLEDYDAARARGATILAIVRGIGEKADDFHRTRSKPDGSAIIGAINRHRRRRRHAPDAIDYINAHGTGTPENDKMEAMSLEAVFGERIRRVPISLEQVDDRPHADRRRRGRGDLLDPDDGEAGVIPPTINYNQSRSGDRASTWCRTGARRTTVDRGALQLVRLRRAERLPGLDGRAGVNAVARVRTSR
jgi:3-oxoacyl-[acyl-carrier-protein] synthase II